MRRVLLVCLMLAGCEEAASPSQPQADASLTRAEATAIQQVRRGDASTCVNPAVQSEIARQVQANDRTLYQDWTAEEVRRFKNEAAFEFEDVTLAGTDPELNRVSCSATFVALWGGHGGDTEITYSVQPDLASDGFVVSIDSVQDAVRAYLYARNDFWTANVKPRVDQRHREWLNRSQYSVASRYCESSGDDDASRVLNGLPQPLNDEERAIRACLEDKAHRHREVVAQQEAAAVARANAKEDRIEFAGPPPSRRD